jgi:ATP-dependent Clp protease ATP-binding subunit ClpX
MDNIDLHFDDAVIDYIVAKAMEYKLGARGLRSLCESIMNDVMFEAPSMKDVKTFTVDIEYARKRIDKINLPKLKVA